MEEPRRGTVAGADQQEVRCRGAHLEAESRQLTVERFTARDDTRHTLDHSALVAQCMRAERFRNDADAPGGPDTTECGADLGSGEGVADAHAREPERLAQGAHEHQVGKTRDQPGGRYTG